MAFTSQSLPTPGFFSAAIQAENENVFENAFGKSSPSANAQAPFFDTSHHEPNFFAPVNAGEYPPLAYAARDSTMAHQTPKLNLNGWDFDEKDSGAHRYPDPSIVRSNASPPLSASGSPDWAFRGFQSQATGPPALQTSNIAVDPRVQYGQITPPDDDNKGGTNSKGQPFRTPPSDHVASNSSSAHPSKTTRSSTSKRKRASSSTEQHPSKGPQGVTKSSQKALRSRKKDDNTMSDNEPNEGGDEKDEKRSKFLERNRVAASKCRQKKKEWTSALEAKARDLQNEKAQLQLMMEAYRAELMYLKNEMLNHTECGSPNIRDYLAREAEAIARGEGGFSPGALLRRRDLAHSELVKNEGAASLRRESVLSRTTNGGTTEGDEESVIGAEVEMAHAS